jgi:hypothetical protein
VFEDLLFEFFGFFGSLVVEIDNISFQAIEFLGLGRDEAGEDLSSGVEFTFEFSFELDFLGVAAGEVLIIDGDVVVAGRLVILMGSVVLLLFSDVSVLEVAQGAQEGVQRISGLELQVDGIKEGLTEFALVNSLDNRFNILDSDAGANNK